MSDSWWGFGLDIEFIDHLQVVTTNNCNAIANIHTLQITREHTKSSQSAFTSRFLVMNLKMSSANIRTGWWLSHNWLTSKCVSVITSRLGPHRKRHSSVAVQSFPWEHVCLKSCYSATRIYLLIKNLLPSNRHSPTACFTVVAKKWMLFQSHSLATAASLAPQLCFEQMCHNIVAYRPVARQQKQYKWDNSCVSRFLISDNWTATEKQRFLRDLCQDVITRTVSCECSESVCEKKTSSLVWDGHQPGS
jgi:hypothetical protein